MLIFFQNFFSSVLKKLYYYGVRSILWASIALKNGCDECYQTWSNIRMYKSHDLLPLGYIVYGLVRKAKKKVRKDQK